MTASPGDPLAELERPRGDAIGVHGLGARYAAASDALTSCGQQLVRSVGRVLGQGWSGSAAAACGAACVRSAQVVLVAARAYEQAGTALAAHGARLAAAQSEFDAARWSADEALEEERAHRGAAAASALEPGSVTSFEDLVWHSPLRAAARLRAEQAVQDAAASARDAAAALAGLTAPLQPPAPAAPEGHWHDQLTGFGTGVWDGVSSPVASAAGLVGLNGDVGENWSALGAGLSQAVTDPGEFAKAVVGWDDLSNGRYGHWLGELAPSVAAAFLTGGAAAGVKGADAAAAAARAGQAATTVTRGLPAALKDVRVLVAETPDGVRLPAGIDATSLQKLLSEAAAAATPAGGRWLTPSLAPDPDAVVRGRPHHIDPNEAPENKRALQRQNETALLLRRTYGYDVEQLDEVKDAKSPDYRIEGRVYDCYAPTSPKARNIADTVARKVRDGQTTRVVLNLDDTPVTIDALEAQLSDWPVEGLQELVAVRGGKLLPLFP